MFVFAEVSKVDLDEGELVVGVIVCRRAVDAFCNHGRVILKAFKFMNNFLRGHCASLSTQLCCDSSLSMRPNANNSQSHKGAIDYYPLLC